MSSRSPTRSSTRPLFAFHLPVLLRESWWLFCAALTLYLALILWTYHPADPGWSHSAEVVQLHNQGGAVGAWLADVALYLFGISAWLWVLFCGHHLHGAYQYFKESPVSGSTVGSMPGSTALKTIATVDGASADARSATLASRWSPLANWIFKNDLARQRRSVAFLGFWLLISASCGLEALNLYQVEVVLPDASGGVLGHILSQTLRSSLGLKGSTLALLTFLAIGFSLFTGYSWLAIAEAVGAGLERLGSATFKRVQRWYDRRLGAAASAGRALAIADEKQKQQHRAPVEIIVPGETIDPLPRRPEQKNSTLKPEILGLSAAVEFVEAAVSSATNTELEITSSALASSSATPILAERAIPAVRIEPSERALREKQTVLFAEPSALPPLELLASAAAVTETIASSTLEYTSRLIESKLADFGVNVQVVAAYPGPVITRYEIEPAVGVKGSQIVNLAKDLARALGMVNIRVVETIPGKTCMALELPNPKRQIVRLSELLGSAAYGNPVSPLTIAMGKDISGQPVVADLAKMPHVLIAGTTGAGKSVAINATILSFLYKSTPSEVRLILIDPKMLEMSVYEGIPHLLAPVVVDMRQAANALNWCVGEMEKRYKLMSHQGVRNLAGFNQKLEDLRKRGERPVNPFSLTPDHPETLEPLPLIVVVIDELADLMMVAGKKIEELIARLAQKARAAGIHLVLATQRPSVDVITGLIKANIPTRVAFQVSSKIDSRTILDQMGAETLLGQGDMLYLPPGSGFPQRVHGAFVADEEVHAVVNYLKQQGEPAYIEGLLEGGESDTDSATSKSTGADSHTEQDPLYDEAVAFVLQSRRASISSVQRQLRIGYNRAARLIEQMENAGLLSAMESNGNRSILVPARDH